MPMTASSPFSLARKRWDRERAERDAHRQALLLRVEAIVRAVLSPEAVDAAYLVGSLVQSGAYDAASDIDIAVLGLPPERYLTVLASLQLRIATDEIDLIELERVPFRAALEHSGHRVL